MPNKPALQGLYFYTTGAEIYRNFNGFMVYSGYGKD